MSRSLCVTNRGQYSAFLETDNFKLDSPTSSMWFPHPEVCVSQLRICSDGQQYGAKHSRALFFTFSKTQVSALFKVFKFIFQRFKVSLGRCSALCSGLNLNLLSEFFSKKLYLLKTDCFLRHYNMLFFRFVRKIF